MKNIVLYNNVIYRIKVNKGIGIENCHYLNDGLWQMKSVK